MKKQPDDRYILKIVHVRTGKELLINSPDKSEIVKSVEKFLKNN